MKVVLNYGDYAAGSTAMARVWGVKVWARHAHWVEIIVSSYISPNSSLIGLTSDVPLKSNRPPGRRRFRILLDPPPQCALRLRLAARQKPIHPRTRHLLLKTSPREFRRNFERPRLALHLRQRHCLRRAPRRARPRARPSHAPTAQAHQTAASLSDSGSGLTTTT